MSNVRNPLALGSDKYWQLEIHNIVHDSTHSKAVLYCITKADTPFMPYHNEQAVFVWFDDNGQINKVEEMFDSAFMNDFMPKFRQYMAEKTEVQEDAQTPAN